MKVRELLTDESKWTKQAWAKSSCNEIVAWCSPKACCWCLIGAIFRCYPRYFDVVGILKLIRGKTLRNATTWNDAPERTFADVRKLVEELDI